MNLSPPKVSSLYQISSLPLDLAHPIYRHYPSAKLGVRESTRHYARLLAPLAGQIITRAPVGAPWLLTAPALINIPAAANYICRSLLEHLKRALPRTVDLTSIEIRVHRSESGPRPSRHRDDYSRLDARQRTLARQAEGRTLLPDEAFRGRAVLFVNDINVTGAQQQCMRQYFEGVGAADVYWLYILDVDASIGRSEPALENVVNSASFASFEEFAALIRREEVDYTGKCLARLFSCSIGQLKGLLPTLGGDRIQRLLDLTLREGAVSAEDFELKLALLRSHAAALHALA